MSFDGNDNMKQGISGSGPDFDADILNALRQSAEYSIDSDDRLSGFFADLHEGCAETLANFIGEKVVTSERSVEMLKFDLTADITADSGELFCKVQGDDGKILFVYSIAQSDFKRLLHLVLSGKIDEGNLRADKLLSPAESKLLVRVFNLFSEFLFGKFEVLAARGVPRNPLIINGQTYAALTELEEFSKVKMNFVAGEFKFLIDMAVPFEMISTPPAVVFTPSEIQEKNKSERIWKEMLRNSIESLPIELEAELISADMSLNEISRLEVGDMLNISFGQKPIRVNYEDGDKAFMTRAELNGSQLLLRVSSGA